MALISCTDCNNQISDTAKICPYCGFDIKKEKKQKNRKKFVKKINDFKNELHTKISIFYKKHKIILSIILLWIIIISFGIYSYKHVEKNQINIMRKKLQGTWHYYYEIDNEWKERKIEIDGNTFTDIYGNYYIIEWKPFDNKFIANNREYSVSDNFNTIFRIDDNYTRPNIYSVPSDVLEINITNKEDKDKRVKCVGTIKNNSDHIFRYINLRGNFLNTNGNSFITEYYEIRNLKPNEIKEFTFTEEWYFLGEEPQWTMKDCIVSVSQAKT